MGRGRNESKGSINRRGSGYSGSSSSHRSKTSGTHRAAPDQGPQRSFSRSSARAMSMQKTKKNGRRGTDATQTVQSPSLGVWNDGGYSANGYGANGYDAGDYGANGYGASGYDGNGYGAGNYGVDRYESDYYEPDYYEPDYYDAGAYGSSSYSASARGIQETQIMETADSRRNRRSDRSTRSSRSSQGSNLARSSSGGRSQGERQGRSSRQSRQAPKKKGINKNKVIIGVICFLLVVLLTGGAFAVRYVVKLNRSLSFDANVARELQAELVDTVKISDPFWVLLLGIDDDEGSGISRSDTIILARINPQNLTAVLISIPRDTRVLIPGYGYDKINAAHAYGGPGLAVKTVSQFADVPISHYAECDFRAFFNLVDALGGVTVDVPVYVPAISSDNTPIYDANGNPLHDLEPGVQVLDGAGALVFCRSRHYDNGDYQRQANQRTFLKALAGELLNSDMSTLMEAAEIIAEGVSTDLSVQNILQIAQSLHGMNMEDIYSYTVPSYMDMIDEISFVIADDFAWSEMINTIKDGGFPETQDYSLAGEAGTYANANADEYSDEGSYEGY